MLLYKNVLKSKYERNFLYMQMLANVSILFLQNLTKLNFLIIIEQKATQKI